MNMFGFTKIFLIAIALLISSPAVAQVEILPGNAARGKQVLEEKTCTRCHRVEGRGGDRAPDLGVRAMRLYSPDLLASVMWNHGPTMWDAIAQGGQAVPTFTTTEAADLFAYFYSILYFSDPGDAGRGRTVFLNKSCSHCHAIDGADGEGKVGPPISAWPRVRDPIDWAERMWNHSERMYEETRRASIPWPQLSTQEMVDLLVYLRNQPDSRSGGAEFALGEPQLGQSLFSSHCVNCHSLGNAEADRVDLLAGNTPPTVTGYAAAMWNHAPVMAERAGRLPMLDPGDMRHLLAYLFVEQYFAESGEVARGADVYRRKSCVVCHEPTPGSAEAPDLFSTPNRYSPITMVEALWNHGPAMLTAFRQRNIYWPLFNGREMMDLIAYLNDRMSEPD